ncbi:MAG: hypothetical protein ACRC8A_00705 [Microcoleaceae cyanobacterium]
MTQRGLPEDRWGDRPRRVLEICSFWGSSASSKPSETFVASQSSRGKYS